MTTVEEMKREAIARLRWIAGQLETAQNPFDVEAALHQAATEAAGWHRKVHRANSGVVDDANHCCGRYVKNRNDRNHHERQFHRAVR